MDSNRPHQAQAQGVAAQVPQMRAVLCADLVDSTALVERLGDIPATELIRRHDRLARDLVQRHRGQEIDKTDGFLILFNRALDAVAFGLDYQRALRELGIEVGQPLRARVGIHLGEVLLWENAAQDVAQGAKPVEVEGLAKPVAARLMGLAAPGQILLSGAAFNLAQRAAGELGEVARNVRWLTHGRYHFKGVPQAQLVHEVGEAGLATLRAPSSTTKAWRDAPFWRRPIAIALEALAAAAILGIALYMVLRPASVIAFAERDWVVLGDLDNRAGEPAFDGALDVALRTGLEQSRFVNVVPHLQVRDAMRRMQSADAGVDRARGVELALREGARAVLLPSVDAKGRNLQFSLELVDPSTGATVAVESASADGPDAILAAVDRATTAMRGRLGESLKDIQQASAPLDRITTANLDALRVFSQLDQTMAERRIADAFGLLRLALELDPEFALAHAYLGVLHLNAEEPEAAYASLTKAAELKDRISLRERLYVETMLSYFGSAADVREKFGLQAQLYPDRAGSQYNLGVAELYWMYDPAASIGAFRKVLDSSHPRRLDALAPIALAQLVLGEVDAARRTIDQAREQGAGHLPLLQDLAIDLALGRIEHLRGALDALPAQLPDRTRGEADHLRAAADVDQGRIDDADGALAAKLVSANASGQWNRLHAKLALARLAIQSHRGGWEPADARDFIARETARMSGSEPRLDRSPELNLAYAALLAQRQGDAGTARELYELLDAPIRSAGRLPQSALLETVRCGLGQAELRLPCLESIAPRFFFVDVASWDAARQAGDQERAARYLQRVSDQRGRAIAELEHMDLLIGNLLDLQRVARTVDTEAGRD